MFWQVQKRSFSQLECVQIKTYHFSEISLLGPRPQHSSTTFPKPENKSKKKEKKKLRCSSRGVRRRIRIPETGDNVLLFSLDPWLSRRMIKSTFLRVFFVISHKTNALTNARRTKIRLCATRAAFKQANV